MNEMKLYCFIYFPGKHNVLEDSRRNIHNIPYPADDGSGGNGVNMTMLGPGGGVREYVCYKNEMKMKKIWFCYMFYITFLLVLLFYMYECILLETKSHSYILRMEKSEEIFSNFPGSRRRCRQRLIQQSEEERNYI